MAVYFIQDESLFLIKIGTAGDPIARMAELQTGSAARLILLASVPGGRAEEQEFHRRFATYRVQGEWFRPGPELLLYLIGRTGRSAQSRPLAPDTPSSFRELARLVCLVQPEPLQSAIQVGLDSIDELFRDCLYRISLDHEFIPGEDRPSSSLANRVADYLKD